MIPYGHQSIDKGDVEAVARVLESDFLTQGSVLSEFEKALCEYTGAKYCVCVSSGTAALHLAVAALELPARSEGITSPMTFVASSNCMVYNGLIPVFADIDLETCCLSPMEVEKKITPKTRLMIPVHYAGAVCNMESFSAIAERNGLRIIEDAAHAIGSEYRSGGRVGCCKFSDCTTFSFHPVKTITSGEGGAVMTNDRSLFEKMRLLRSHGIAKDGFELSRGPWYYEMRELGFNYRMTDIQAALGCSQLKRIGAFAARRREIFREYNRAFSGQAFLRVPYEQALSSECRHLYPLRIDFSALGMTRTEFMLRLRKSGIGSQVHYIPVHLQPYYQREFGYASGACPVAEAFYEQELSLPLYSSMTSEDIKQVIYNVLHIIVKDRS